MGNGDSIEDRRPAHKKRKINSSETGQSDSNRASERRNLNEEDESDDIEILYDGRNEKEKEAQKKSKDSDMKSKESENRSSEAEKVKALTQQLEESILREKEMNEQLAVAKGIEESLKEERDDSKRMYDKCLIWTRHWELRAVHAETVLANVDEAKVANDPQLRQENIKLYKRLGELKSENIKLQETITKGKIQSEPVDDKLEKLTEEVEKLRKEKEEWKEERNRRKKKQEKEESERRKEIDELKAELKRTKKKRDNYADDADHWEKEAKYHKEEKIKIICELDDVKGNVRVLRKDKEKWMDDWEKEKKENVKLDNKVKELEGQLKKECENGEEMKKKLESLAVTNRCDGSTQTENAECKEKETKEELEKNQLKEPKKEEKVEIYENAGSGDSTVTSLPTPSDSTPSDPSAISIAPRLPSVLRDVNGGSSDFNAEMEKIREEGEQWRNLLDIELSRTEKLESELKDATDVIKKYEDKMSAENKLEKCEGSSQTEKVECEEVKEMKTKIIQLTVQLGDATTKIKKMNAEKARLESNVSRPTADHWERNAHNGQQQLQPRLSHPQQQFVQQPQQHPHQLMQQVQQPGSSFPHPHPHAHPHPHPHPHPQQQPQFVHHLHQHAQSFWQQSQQQAPFL